MAAVGAPSPDPVEALLQAAATPAATTDILLQALKERDATVAKLRRELDARAASAVGDERSLRFALKAHASAADTAIAAAELRAEALAGRAVTDGLVQGRMASLRSADVAARAASLTLQQTQELHHALRLELAAGDRAHATALAAVDRLQQRAAPAAPHSSTGALGETGRLLAADLRRRLAVVRERVEHSTELEMHRRVDTAALGAGAHIRSAVEAAVRQRMADAVRVSLTPLVRETVRSEAAAAVHRERGLATARAVALCEVRAAMEAERVAQAAAEAEAARHAEEEEERRQAEEDVRAAARVAAKAAREAMLARAAQAAAEEAERAMAASDRTATPPRGAAPETALQSPEPHDRDSAPRSARSRSRVSPGPFGRLRAPPRPFIGVVREDVPDGFSQDEAAALRHHRRLRQKSFPDA